MDFLSEAIKNQSICLSHTCACTHTNTPTYTHTHTHTRTHTLLSVFVSLWFCLSLSCLALLSPSLSHFFVCLFFCSHPLSLSVCLQLTTTCGCCRQAEGPGQHGAASLRSVHQQLQTSAGPQFWILLCTVCAEPTQQWKVMLGRVVLLQTLTQLRRNELNQLWVRMGSRVSGMLVSSALVIVS